MEALPQLTDEEFEQIEEAIARSAKGRAFLRRAHRRAMGAASEEIRRLLVEFRQSWQEESHTREMAKRADVLRRELLEMAASIEQARREVAALRPPDGNKDRIVTATSELDAIVISTERASFEILNAAEKLMDLSSRLRGEGANGDLCGQIENEVSNIFTACSFQDLTGQRTSKVVNALRYIEQRINAMIGIWGADGLRDVKPIAEEVTDKRPDAYLLHGPQLDGQGVSQEDVDSMFGGGGAMPAPSPASSVASQADVDHMFDPPATVEPPPQSSQADIDSLFDSPKPAPAPMPEAPRASQADIDNLFGAPAPAPAPIEPPPQSSQADIDSLFDSPKPAKPAKPATPAKPAPKPAPKPEAPATEVAPLDQSAIDALFG